ncbi:MAG: Uma2 family endonuclease [Leptospiraceae bacterium]|nr:Uma2 family endonuclease [Leptospiraceae bacterium]
MEERAAYISESEYIALEENSKYKNEYFNGQIYAMAGASENHNIIATNILSELRFQLKKKDCIVYGSDMRVKVKKTGLYTYPDISIACGDRKFSGEKPDTLLNPIVIIEILSDSTEAFDRGGKFAHYRQLDSLYEYILVSQTEKKIEKFLRNHTGKWELTETTMEALEMELLSVDCKLLIEEVYEKTDFTIQNKA